MEEAEPDETMARIGQLHDLKDTMKASDYYLGTNLRKRTIYDGRSMWPRYDWLVNGYQECSGTAFLQELRAGGRYEQIWARRRMTILLCCINNLLGYLGAVYNIFGYLKQQALGMQHGAWRRASNDWQVRVCFSQIGKNRFTGTHRRNYHRIFVHHLTILFCWC